MSIDTLPQPDSLADTPANDPPLNLRLRSDLVVVEQVTAREKKQVVKDPLSLEYFHFGEQEWFVLECLRQPTTLHEIQRRFRQQFPPLRIQLETLKIFLARVLQDNLVIPDRKLGLGTGYLEQASQKRKAEQKFRWVQILYIRFRGIDPNNILSLLRPVGNVIFNPLFMAAAALAMCLTLAFVIVQFDQVSSRLPETIDLFRPQNLLLMALVIGVVKIFHELGHGLACQRLGGECRELGILLLAFVPCLYCNVSDTWLEPRRTRRMMVSAAGIFVELLLAIGCFVLWYGSHPGTMNSICLNVVLICSLNTLFINGNPLLRYDGYYLLADLVDVPNLAQQARAARSRAISRLLFRNPGGGDSGSLRDVALAIYSVASLAYRVLVIGAILFGIHMITKANDVEVIGNLAIIIALAGVLLPAFYQLSGRIKTRSRDMRWKPLSALLMLIGAAGILALVCLVPLPHQISAPVVVELRDPAMVFAPRGGRLEWVVSEGDAVKRGDLIARIENLELEERRGIIERSINEKSTRLQNLLIRAKDETEPIPELPILKTELTELEKQLSAQMSEIAKLELRSPRAGVVFPGPSRPREFDPRVALNQWHGSLLDPLNFGCFVERGQPLCLIGDPAELRAAVYVEQNWVEEVRQGSKVRFCFDHSSYVILDGTVYSVVGESVVQVPESLVANRMIAVADNGSGRLMPAQPVFRVDCRFADVVPKILPGSTGTAKILIQHKTVLQRLARFVNGTFRRDW